MKQKIILLALLVDILFAADFDYKNMEAEFSSIKQEYEFLQKNKEELNEKIEKELNIEYIIETKNILLPETFELIKDDNDYIFVSTVLKMIQTNDESDFSLDFGIRTLVYSKINDLSFKYQLIDIQKLADQLDKLTQNKVISMDSIKKEIVVRNNNSGANIREHPIYNLSPSIVISKDDIPDGTVLGLFKDVRLGDSHWGKIIVLTGKYAGTIGWINLNLTKGIF
jgi:hypothetical protein